MSLECEKGELTGDERSAAQAGQEKSDDDNESEDEAQKREESKESEEEEEIDDEKSASEDDEGDESDEDEAKESGKEEAGHVKVNKQLPQTLQNARNCECEIQGGVASKCVVKPSNKIPATTISASIGS